MRKRSSTTDPVLLAKRAFDSVTDDKPAPPRRKNPAAVAMGKLGGPKGGPARAAALSPKRRTEIARKAAVARWAKRKDQART